MAQVTLQRRPYVTLERLIAIVAVAATAFGFTQPQLRAVAGLDFDRSPTFAHGTDPMPTASIPRASDSRLRAEPTVHGLAGTLRPLRGRE